MPANSTPAPTPAATPAPAPTPPAPPAPRRKPYALILRQFSGFAPGQILDASDWRHTDSLANDRFISLPDKDVIDAAVPCTACKTRWVDEDARDAHDCSEE